jgi:hypothetical protein
MSQGAESGLIQSRLPFVPSSGKNVLGSDEGGRPEWNNIQDLYTRLAAIEQRLDAASIDAECKAGEVTVTLNL